MHIKETAALAVQPGREGEHKVVAKAMLLQSLVDARAVLSMKKEALQASERAAAELAAMYVQARGDLSRDKAAVAALAQRGRRSAKRSRRPSPGTGAVLADFAMMQDPAGQGRESGFGPAGH